MMFTLRLPTSFFVCWLLSMYIWIAMTDGISRNSAYTGADRMKLANVYFAVTIVALWIAVVYWRLLGLI